MRRRATAQATTITESNLKRAFPTFHRLAATRAVLVPLCNLDEVTFPPRLAMVEVLRSLWQHRLHQLQTAGWKPIQHPRSFAYAFNCPCLSFAKDETGKRPCNLYRVCPFCYGLRASILYENILRATRRHPHRLDLYLLSKDQWGSIDDVGELLDEVTTQDPLDTQHVAGYVNRISVSPWVGDPNRVWIRRATLVALPAGSGAPKGKDAWLRVELDEVSLARATAALYEYPIGLLYGDAGAAVKVLDQISCRHLGRARGIFRSARSVVSVLQCRDQRVAPGVLPPTWQNRLNEEETLACNIDGLEFDHERFALRSFLALLGRSAAKHKGFAGARSLPFPMTWLGDVRFSFSELIRSHKKHFKQACRPFRNVAEHGFAFRVPGQMYVGMSTLPFVADDYGFDFGVFQCSVQGRSYTIELLGQLAARLKAQGSSMLAATDRSVVVIAGAHEVKD